MFEHAVRMDDDEKPSAILLTRKNEAKIVDPDYDKIKKWCKTVQECSKDSRVRVADEVRLILTDDITGCWLVETPASAVCDELKSHGIRKEAYKYKFGGKPATTIPAGMKQKLYMRESSGEIGGECIEIRHGNKTLWLPPWMFSAVNKQPDQHNGKFASNLQLLVMYRCFLTDCL